MKLPAKAAMPVKVFGIRVSFLGPTPPHRPDTLPAVGAGVSFGRAGVGRNLLTLFQITNSKTLLVL